MFERLKFWLIIVLAALLLAYMLPIRNIKNYFQYTFVSKSNLNITMSKVNPEVKSISMDSSNRLALRVEVRDTSGTPVSNVEVNFSVNNGIGEIYPNTARTDKYGECLADFIPPQYSSKLLQDNPKVTLSANLYKSISSASVTVALTRIPVVLVHGYLSSGDIFRSLKDYLQASGINTTAITYKSEKGVVSSSKELQSYLQNLKLSYLSKGIQFKRFNIVAHSMGGLVARYYTCSTDYLKYMDVNKLIFISVPHRGSVWASVGENYYKNQGIRDLNPDNSLYTKTLPSMLNKGLNNTIQVGNILGQYDEVVSPESASLEDWSIKTEVFNVGDSHFTVNDLLNGNIIEAANHKVILNNKKVFERIKNMLETNLPFPTKKK
jgi:pimeloyl-ACP methyl ester carboxylesterase